MNLEQAVVFYKNGIPDKVLCSCESGGKQYLLECKVVEFLGPEARQKLFTASLLQTVKNNSEETGISGEVT